MLQNHSTTAHAPGQLFSDRPDDPAAHDPRRNKQPARGCIPYGIGQVIVSEGARAALDDSGEPHDQYLRRHASGDWRESLEDEREENRAAIREGRGVFSTHLLKTGARLWLATIPDRSRTVIFTPGEV